MSIGSPTTARINSFIYGGEGEEKTTEDLDSEGGFEPEAATGKPESMYVTLFEDALKTVLANERHLFSPREIVCFKRYSELSYNARYLLIRLCLRKNDKWHRLSNLKYRSELGDGIPDAIRELCGGDPKKTSHFQQVKIEPIDLTLDEACSQPVAGPSKLPPPPPPVPAEPDLSDFADDDSRAELCELLDCLTLDELREVAKQTKADWKGPRTRIVEALLKTTSTQSTLPFAKLSTTPVKSKKAGFIQTKLTFTSLNATEKRQTQLGLLRVIVMKILQHCVHLNNDVVKLFQRVNLVYFRSTQHTSTLLTPSILAQARKRTYAAYTAERTLDIWPTREALLEYEKALELEAQVDAHFDGVTSNRSRFRSVASKTPAPTARCRPPTESPSKRRSTRGQNEDDGVEYVPEVKEDSPRVQAAKFVKAILQEVLPKWEILLTTKDEYVDERHSSLRRFECGHILTRIVCKGTYALGILKEFGEELRVLEMLLSQRKWRRGRRGRWHERKALILMTHTEKTKDMYEEARKATTAGLEDNDTHIVHRPALVRRLTRLENKLKFQPHERFVCEGVLKKAEEVHIIGTRVQHQAQTLKLDKNFKIVSSPTKSTRSELKVFDLSLLRSPDPKSNIKPELEQKTNGKSIWEGRDGEEVTVEIFALRHYEERGFKGFHCEGRIVTTLFGLLFWDVLFAAIPGAFETSYQSAPLDIAEDTFYISRQDMIDERLKEIRDGKAPKIIARFDDEHRETKTMCVGVRWELFQKQDLLEISECLGGEGLATICQLLCEDYAGRTAGVPDLIVWNIEENLCKFVEVKGPGDSLQENQKVWIDVLARAGVPVDICFVAEKDGDPKFSGKKSKPKAKHTIATTPGRRRKRTPAPESDYVEEVEKIIIEIEPKEHQQPAPSQTSTQMATSNMSIDIDENSIPPATPLDSLESLVSTTPKSRKRVEVLLPSPRPFKKMRRTRSPSS